MSSSTYKLDKSKSDISEKIETDMEAFLAKGGTIQKCTTEDNAGWISYHNRHGQKSYEHRKSNDRIFGPDKPDKT